MKTRKTKTGTITGASTLVLALITSGVLWVSQADAAGPNRKRPGVGPAAGAAGAAARAARANRLRMRPNAAQRRVNRQMWLQRKAERATRLCAQGNPGQACRAALLGGGILDVSADGEKVRIITPEGDIITDGLRVPEDLPANIIEGSGPVNRLDDKADDHRHSLTCTDASGQIVSCPTF